MRRKDLAVGSLVLDSPTVNEGSFNNVPVGIGGIGVVLVHSGDDGFTVSVDVGLVVGGPFCLLSVVTGFGLRFGGLGLRLGLGLGLTLGVALALP